jgi:cellulose synthase (UDP-forming)
MKYATNAPRGDNHQIPLLYRIISAISIAYFLYYLWWRAASTLNPDALVFSWVLLLAEAFGVLSYILFSWMTQDISPNRTSKPPRTGLSVDIFIPTYNENIEILEATMVGCRKIKYPHRTYILDDGKRDEIKKLATLLGCIYLSRPTNEHAKAGNINYALTKTSGEFIVVLDADMVPQPDFLDRTLGYFEDEKLAFIQMPQEFYNQDSIQHDQGQKHWHEQSLFFRVIQPGKNHSNSAFWCGSPSVVRRKALEEVDGVATETITEDIHTSVRLHRNGWSSFFLNEVLAYGIAPQTIKSFLVQRLRWAQGTMQLYRSSESPLWIKGLTVRQRLSYLSSFLAYFESFQKLILIMMPVFIIMFHIFPMRVSVLDFLLHWAPYFALNVWANSIGGRGYFRYFQTEKYNILKMAVFVQSTLTLFHTRSLQFKVTPKSVDDSVYKEERRTLRVYMVILGAMTGAIFYGLFRTIFQPTTSLEKEAYLIAIFWAGYNAMLIFIGIHEVLEKSHERKQYRFPVNLRGELHHGGYVGDVLNVQVENFSITGASLILDHQYLADNNSRFLLHIHIASRKLIVLEIGKIHRQVRDAEGRIHVGISFIDKQDFYRERLFEYLFVYVPAMQPVVMGQKSPVQDLFEIQAVLMQRLGSKGSKPLLEDTIQ